MFPTLFHWGLTCGSGWCYTFFRVDAATRNLKLLFLKWQSTKVTSIQFVETFRQEFIQHIDCILHVHSKAPLPSTVLKLSKKYPWYKHCHIALVTSLWSKHLHRHYNRMEHRYHVTTRLHCSNHSTAEQQIFMFSNRQSRWWKVSITCPFEFYSQYPDRISYMPQRQYFSQCSCQKWHQTPFLQH